MISFFSEMAVLSITVSNISHIALSHLHRFEIYDKFELNKLLNLPALLLGSTI